MKILRFTLHALLALALTACSDIDETSSSNDLVTVTFSVALPEGDDEATRAYADGLTATYLSYAVYVHGTTDIYNSYKTAVHYDAFEDHVATVSFTLAKGGTYDFLFFADSESSPYTLDLAAQTLTMDYSDSNSTLAANDESRDAFYKTVKLTATSSSSQTVTLKRAVAQVNVGSNDLKTNSELKACYAEASYTTTFPAGMPTVLNLVSGETSGEMESELTFAATGIADESETFPKGDSYEYVQMNYVLAPTTNTVLDKVTVGMTHSSLDEVSVDVENVQVRMNYQTNIYGNVFTTNAKINVVIDPAFVSTSWYNNAEEFLNAINDGEEYIGLTCDLTLTSTLFVFSPTTEIDLNGFTLTFDTSDYCIIAYSADELTIKNGTIKAENGIYAYCGTLKLDNLELILRETTTQVQYGLNLTPFAKYELGDVTIDIESETGYPAYGIYLYYTSSQSYMKFTDKTGTLQTVYSRTNNDVTMGDNCTIRVKNPNGYAIGAYAPSTSPCVVLTMGDHCTIDVEGQFARSVHMGTISLSNRGTSINEVHFGDSPTFKVVDYASTNIVDPLCGFIYTDVSDMGSNWTMYIEAYSAEYVYGCPYLCNNIDEDFVIEGADITAISHYQGGTTTSTNSAFIWGMYLYNNNNTVTRLNNCKVYTAYPEDVCWQTRYSNIVCIRLGDNTERVFKNCDIRSYGGWQDYIVYTSGAAICTFDNCYISQQGDTNGKYMYGIYCSESYMKNGTYCYVGTHWPEGYDE